MSLANRVKEFIRVRPVRARVNRGVERMAKQVAAHAPAANAAPVVFFNASTRLNGVSLNAAFSMLTGWSLRLQGVPVVHFVCQAGLKRCVLGTKTADLSIQPPCSHCQQQSKAIYQAADVQPFTFTPDPDLQQALQGLDVAALMAYDYKGVPLGSLCLPAMRWILRRHHLIDDACTRQLYRDYIESAWGVASQFEALLKRVKPQSVVVFNGMFYPEATARWVAHQHGLTVFSHEVGLAPDSVFFTTGEATAYPVEIPEDFQLNEQQAARLDAYLSKRFKGNFSMAGIQFWKEMTGLDEALLAKISQFKQLVPVFTNVIFDTSQPHANVVYPHMFAWLDEVLAIARAHVDTLFVIRAHPDESRPGKASNESVADWVRSSKAEEVPNVVFIPSDQYLSSYELIQRAKFVMIYNSTIGMEASIMGAAVLSAGKARFTQLPTVFFPKTVESYRKTVAEMLTADKIDVPAEFAVNARRFLYFQLYCTSLPFTGYLEADGIWNGFVKLKQFDCAALKPENSVVMKIISDGILQGKDFLMDV